MIRWSAWSILLGLIAPSALQARPHLNVAIAFSDETDADKRWDHLDSLYESASYRAQKGVMRGLGTLPRCRLVSRAAQLDQRGRSVFQAEEGIDFVLHFVLRRIDRLYRNRTLYYTEPSAATLSGSADSQPREVAALPALSAAIEVRLIETQRDKIVWSALQDSTIMLQHDNRFVYNPDKYPGYTHPEVIRDYVAPIMRQRFKNPPSLRMLNSADRWYLSPLENDAAIGGHLIDCMIRDLLPQIDAHLPLWGTISTILATDEDNRPQYRIDRGANHGIIEGMQLDVFQRENRQMKLGRVKVVAVGPTSATVRLHKLERAVRKRGQTLGIGDLVFSKQRPVHYEKRVLQ